MAIGKFHNCCGCGGNVCIFWDIWKPYHVHDGSTWSIHGDCS
uniref:Uncharacterized protein MANES_18G104800 n=1 Tax=Rhizophora mucronata TaxID=61149 RepID=A0A2P2IJ99_RHIMU